MFSDTGPTHTSQKAFTIVPVTTMDTHATTTASPVLSVFGGGAGEKESCTKELLALVVSLIESLAQQ